MKKHPHSRVLFLVFDFVYEFDLAANDNAAVDYSFATRDAVDQRFIRASALLEYHSDHNFDPFRNLDVTKYLNRHSFSYFPGIYSAAVLTRTPQHRQAELG